MRDTVVALDMERFSISSAESDKKPKESRERIADILWTKPDAHAAYIAALPEYDARGGVVTRREQDGTTRYLDAITGKRIASADIVNVGGFARRKAS